MRIGLRVLAVGGLAGAAWLLSAASAHAAEAKPVDDAPADLSVVSLVDGTLTRTLAPVISPELVPVAPAGTVVLPSATAASATRIAAQPATRPDGDRVPATRAADASTRTATSRDRSGSGDGVLAGTVRGLTTPLGLTGALAGPTGLLTPLTRAVDPVVAPLNGVLRPVTGVLLSAAQPVTSTLGSVTRTVTGFVDPAERRAQDLTPAVTPVPGTDGTRAGNGSASVLGTPLVHLAGVSTTSGDRHLAGTELRSAGTPDERPGGGNLPDRHYPAPLRAYFGAGAGIPASGPGSHAEGGAFATVPSSVVERTVATHRLPVTTDVAALRHDAEAPTVSPD
ncbi:hypothetical protein [Phytohabitans rumicis]|uniref:hypothetical protein n=1 Tax=Phytohabitans rumicis TaxID=1076125 RepID=UPI0015647620|nr:hypothetical protein [Phytohabitans rumicis]